MSIETAELPAVTEGTISHSLSSASVILQTREGRSGNEQLRTRAARRTKKITPR